MVEWGLWISFAFSVSGLAYQGAHLKLVSTREKQAKKEVYNSRKKKPGKQLSMQLKEKNQGLLPTFTT